MGELPDALHGCTAEDAEEAEAVREADGISWGKHGDDGRIGEGKRYPDQHGADGNEGQGANHNAHADSSRVHQMVWSDGEKVGQYTKSPDRGGGESNHPHTQERCDRPHLLEGGRQAHLGSGGVLLEPRLLLESITHQQHVPPFGATDGSQGESHMRGQHGGLVVEKPKNLMEKVVSRKKDSE